MYAVLETGGKQYRVAQGDTLEIERLEVAAGQPFTLTGCSWSTTGGAVSVGAPTVAGARSLPTSWSTSAATRKSSSK